MQTSWLTGKQLKERRAARLIAPELRPAPPTSMTDFAFFPRIEVRGMIPT